MATLSAEDVQALRDMGSRVTAVEAATAAQTRELIRINTEATGLVEALRLEFNDLRAKMTAMELELKEPQEAFDAMSSGRAGAAGRALLDPRLLEEPGREMSLVKAGAAPCVQTQHGSPSSNPFDCPSPSLSALQKATLHR